MVQNLKVCVDLWLICYTVKAGVLYANYNWKKKKLIELYSINAGNWLPVIFQ